MTGNTIRALTPGTAIGLWTPNRARMRWFDALSLLLPAGERFVIDVARDAALTHPLEPAMADAVAQLIREEQAHQRVHQRYNEALAAQGLPVADMQSRLNELMAPLMSWPLERRLLLAAALEQWTALLAGEVLRHRRWLGPQGGNTVRMWRWHCAEEIEHHGTVIALARSSVRAPWQWTATFIVAAFWLCSDVRRIQSEMLRVDIARRHTTRWAVWWDRACFAAGTASSILRLICLAAPHIMRLGGWHHHRRQDVAAG